MAAARLWLMVPRQIRQLPADLAAVIGLVVLTDLSVLTPVVRETPIRIVFGLAFVLFLPGYAFISALFPEAGESPGGGKSTGDGESPEDSESPDGGAADGGSGLTDRGIDGIERVALSFGLSIAIVPLIGLVLNFTPWGIRLVPIVLSVSGFTLVATGVGAVRRRALPEDERFRVPYEQWYRGLRAELVAPESRTDAALNVVLVASIVLAVSSVAYAVAVPKQGEAFTEFYLLTENETGDLVAAGYPTEFERGETAPVVVGIGNHEHETTEYTVVVELARVEFENESNSTTVIAEDELGRLQARIRHNETWTRNYSVRPTMTGQRLRLTFLLYRDGAATEPTVANSYRNLHLWVNVSESDA